jgi:hypothetical protein
MTGEFFAFGGTQVPNVTKFSGLYDYVGKFLTNGGHQNRSNQEQSL